MSDSSTGQRHIIIFPTSAFGFLISSCVDRLVLSTGQITSQHSDGAVRHALRLSSWLVFALMAKLEKYGSKDSMDSNTSKVTRLDCNSKLTYVLFMADK